MQPQSYDILPNGHVISFCEGVPNNPADVTVIHFDQPQKIQFYDTMGSQDLSTLDHNGIYLSVKKLANSTAWFVNITKLVNIDHVEFYCKFPILNSYDYYSTQTAVIKVINGKVQ